MSAYERIVNWIRDLVIVLALATATVVGCFVAIKLAWPLITMAAEAMGYTSLPSLN
jgi:hypothetical protein